MKKKLLILLFILLSLPLFSSPSIYMRSGYSFSFDTNIFSYPLVKTGGKNNKDYLQFRIDNPFIYRIDHNFKAATEIYFNEEGRTGISLMGEIGFPFRAVTYTPSSSDPNSDWNYIKADALSMQPKKLFFGIGPSFRAILNNIDLGFNIRALIGSYNHFTKDLIIGINSEGFINYFFDETFFFFTNIDLSAHFLSFYLDKKLTQLFKDNYIMASVSASIGLGIKFGPRGNV